MNQPPRSNCMLMAALPSAVGQARAYARWVLGRWQLSVMVDTVQLLVSELVTNAVNATGVIAKPADERSVADKVKPLYLSLSVHADTLLIEVWDASSVPPLRRVASEDDETGRGLMLVQTLSKDWGCEVLETGGKVVWCKCLVTEATSSAQ
jgi:anti-sigma regulatory factor (Ser/Thr protein kinase)